MITPTEMEKRKKLIETESSKFNVGNFLSSDFPTYDSYNCFMNMYEEARREKGLVTPIETYKLMRKALVLPGSHKEIALKLAGSPHPTLELVLRAYKPLFYSLFSAEDYSSNREGTDYVDSIIRNMGKLPCTGSQYTTKQLIYAINYTVYPELMQAPKKGGDFKWEAGYRQFFMSKRFDELKIMFNNPYTSADYFFFSSGQAAMFKSTLFESPKGIDDQWSGAQIQYALEKALKVGFETEAKAINELYVRDKEEKYFILKNATAAVRYSYMPDSRWSQLRQYFIEEWHNHNQNDYKAAEMAYHRLFTAIRVEPVIGKVVTVHHHKLATTTVTKFDLNFKEKPALESINSLLEYPGSYPMSDSNILRNFLILADKQLMSIINEGRFLSWSNNRGTLSKEVEKALSSKPKTARKVREAIEAHFKQFGWKEFPTFAELVQAGLARAKVP